jgi:hypothetical protein
MHDRQWMHHFENGDKKKCDAIVRIGKKRNINS